MSHRISFFIYPQFQLLDLTGPLAVFEAAEAVASGSYRWKICAKHAGQVASSCAVSIGARPLVCTSRIDTVLVVGGSGSQLASQCSRTQTYLRRCASNELRIASVCTGSYFLAAAGLLCGKKATTHWNHSADIAELYPDVNWQADKIFTRAGNIWTSAGVTAGIDLALALVTEDLGEQVARSIARHLVVYYRRPGGQSQFSSLLDEESPAGRFEGLLDHIRQNLREPLTVPQLAAHCGMSERNFARLFRAETGRSPAKVVERIRAEAARTALENGMRSVAQVAQEYGFGDPERMRRCFLRLFGMPPGVLRARPSEIG